MSIFNDAKKSVQTITEKTGNIAKSASNFVNNITLSQLMLLEPQWLNQFEVFFYNPSALKGSSGLVSSALNVALAAQETLFFKTYIQNATIPFPSLEYERINERMYPKQLVHPAEFTMSFIENSGHKVLNYMSNWFNVIYFWDEIEQTYLFYEDQEVSKRSLKIFLLKKTGAPGPIMISMEGVKPRSIAEITLGQSEGGPLIPTVTFVADKIVLKDFSGEVAGTVAGTLL